jgi:CRISPR/Cas system type I-B associated protein Csh2 (Cas7 group RAMP superfamily)
MKSVVMKSIYAGLGLLSTGKESVEEIGRKLAKKASLSEKDGEKIARELRTRSEKAISSLQKTLEAEVNKVVHALHPATGGGKSTAKRKKAKSTATAAKHRTTAKKKA